MYDNVAVIELAAGLGTRFGEKKQFVEFHGKPIWKHIYDKVLKKDNYSLSFDFITF